ncbi:MAG: ABC transporter substrate-binding protein [Tepidiforma sp.]
MKGSLRRLLLLGAVASLAASALVAAACGGDDDDTASTATPAAGETATAAPASPSPAAAYPVTVTDMLGRKVEIKAEPKTIVAVSPTAVELVYAAGKTVAGRPSTANYPPEAQSAQAVGTAYQPNLEAILALKPDLVIADSVIHAQPALRQPLEGLPVPVIFAGANSYKQVLDALRLVGTALNATATTDRVIADIEKSLADARKALEGKKVSAVAILSDRDQTLYAAKSTSYTGDILKELGITNPADALPDAGPFPGYATIAPEKLVEFNPDYIFAITPAPPPAPRLANLIPTIPPFRGLKAVTSNHVVDSDVELFVQAPGPRVKLAFEAVAKAVSGQ